MPIAVGIDLGTTQSSVAIYQDKEITVIPQERWDSSGSPHWNNFLPSIVSFTSNDVLVGHLAEEQSTVNPENTIFGVKKIIGRRFDEPQLHKFIDGVPYTVENVGGNPKISVNYKGEKRSYVPESISAIILKKLKIKAEIILGHKITDAVITVPSCFNDSQRQATKDSGTLAGLNVLQILNESTAAAIAYGYHKYSENERYVLIYDFGGGMFDVSVLKIKNGNTFETKLTVGDTSLGGFEVDDILVDYCADVFYKEHRNDIKSNLQAMKRLGIACSRAKNILSSENETFITVDDLLDGIDFRLSISRTKFEELCEGIFNRTIELLHQVVVDSGLNKTDIEDVILVGGLSEIPKIRQLVSNYFDEKCISRSFDSALAVTRGAAIQAAFLSGYKDWDIVTLLCVDVASLSIGIEKSNGIMANVIERGTPIPVKELYTTTAHTDNQSGVTIKIFEGESALTCDNHLLGILELSGLPPLHRGVLEEEVIFKIDLNGILTVSTEEKFGMTFSTISELDVSLDKGRLSKDDIDRMLNEADEFNEEEEIERGRTRYRNALENYVHTICKAAFTNARNRISIRDKLEINKICNEIRDWLERNPTADVMVIIKKRNAAVRRLQPYASVLDQSIMSRADTGFEE